MPGRLKKYLRSRATLSPWRLEGVEGDVRTDRTDHAGYAAALVIPVLAERQTLPRTLASLTQNPPELLAQTLIVVVVNHRSSASLGQKIESRQTLDWLRSDPCPKLNLAWADACSPNMELPPNEGVGLARKIGFDLGLSCLDWSVDPLLISLDADSLVDEYYLSAIFAHFRASSCSGAYLPFRHQCGQTAGQEAAIRLYELYLRSYLCGLKWANSPYAFTAIGSALACRAQAYVAAAGMKRRQAGEDFYFLQQLVKTGEVSPLTGTVVRPAARYSDRVPFGTGRALAAEVEEGRRLFQFISLSSFSVLRAWLSAVEVNQAEHATDLQGKAAQISPTLAEYLEEVSFCKIWQQLQRQVKGPQFLTAWHQWFDGLRTRQLLSRLEAQVAEAAPEELVAELLAVAGSPCCRGLAAQLKQLEAMQGVSVL